MPRQLDPAEGNWVWSASESDSQTRMATTCMKLLQKLLRPCMRTTSVPSPKVGGARQHAMPPTASRLESRWKWCYATIRDGRGWAPSIHHHRPLSPFHLLSLYISFLLYSHSSFMHGSQKTLIFGFHLRGKFLPIFPPVSTMYLHISSSFFFIFRF